ncbi:T9SS type A sorting domain-containing protein, partial [candidate division KSB1 bacterium]|nr:T9SS type A sorting domain-containing protein [candidate division KSB1 bacterium]
PNVENSAPIPITSRKISNRAKPSTFNIWFNYSKGSDVNAIANNKTFLVNHLSANNNDIVDPQLNGISRAQDNGLDPRPAIGGAAFANLAEISTSVKIQTDSKVIPNDFDLSQNYPNPFNPTTTIQFNLPVAANVKLTVYNLMGQAVATLISENRVAGIHKVQWDASSLPSGMYVYRLEAGSMILNRKLTILK